MLAALTNEQCRALVKGIILQSLKPSQFYKFANSETPLALTGIRELWMFLG